MSFKVNRPAVVHEEFEDEVVVVNLDTGRYYSMQRVAAVIWRALDTGAARDEITARVADAYEAPIDQIDAAVTEFTGKLEQEALIVAAPDAPAQVERPVEARPPDTPKAPFATPTFDVYSDMQDLLVLDPIHEVDATGWPNPKPTAGPDA